MTSEDAAPAARVPAAPDATPRRDLPPAALRALAEAEERRRAAETAPAEDAPREIQGRKGPEPVRYGDWEMKGLAVDF